MRTSSTPICYATHLASRLKSNVVLPKRGWPPDWRVTLFTETRHCLAEGSVAFGRWVAVHLIERKMNQPTQKKSRSDDFSRPTCCFIVVTPGGFEPPTPGLGNLCSIP